MSARADLFKAAFVLLALGLVILWAIFVTGCGYAAHKDPTLYTFDNAKVVEQSARLEARDKGGSAHPVVCCGSMKPLIETGDWVVAIPAAFTDDLLGKVVLYRPKWAKGSYVVHRLVSGDSKGGFIPSGDNNPQSESLEYVTIDKYRGEVVSIYRLSASNGSR